MPCMGLTHLLKLDTTSYLRKVDTSTPVRTDQDPLHLVGDEVDSRPAKLAIFAGETLKATTTTATTSATSATTASLTFYKKKDHQKVFICTDLYR